MIHGKLDRAALVANLIRDEGIRLKIYQDTVGKWTIGIGRNLSDRGISRDEAMTLLHNDIDSHLREVRAALPWFDALDEVRQRAVVNMAFNLGVPKLMEFRNTLQAIADGDWRKAAAGMRASLWAKQVGARAERLAQMIERGKE